MNPEPPPTADADSPPPPPPDEHPANAETEPDTPPPAPPQPLFPGLKKALLVLIAAPVLATFLGYLGRFAWWLDLFSHFRIQYTLLLLIPTLIAAATRRRRMAMVAGGLLAVYLLSLSPFYLPRWAEADPDAPRWTLIQMNLGRADPQSDLALNVVKQNDADIVCLQEVTADWRDAVREQLPDYRVVAQRTRQDDFGIMLLIHRQRPLSTVRAQVRTINGVPAIDATLKLAGENVRLRALHTLPPVSAANTHERNQQLHATIDWAGPDSRRTVLIGDLNATPWSAPMRELYGRTNLVDSRRGNGLLPTWPAPAIPG
ncbi:MAG: endonuclease/exonuclease/phosphatase family protein, partial [Phycisphaeraceae bacterium]|nr:endonuclease/exonuclease/phosphatase family protein [Phycisphaeraceae bacterium]